MKKVIPVALLALAVYKLANLKPAGVNPHVSVAPPTDPLTPTVQTPTKPTEVGQVVAEMEKVDPHHPYVLKLKHYIRGTNLPEALKTKYYQAFNVMTVRELASYNRWFYTLGGDVSKFVLADQLAYNSLNKKYNLS